MPNLAGYKDKLLEDLWLPTVQKCGAILFPRTRRNKEMKLLTLTSDKGYQEVTKLEENNLTRKECVIAWTYSHIKKLRLETEISPVRVVGTTKYEDSVVSSSFSISGDFPFHILNLDFSSQDPSFETGRIEKEIKGLENTLMIQKRKGGTTFALMYTTVLNSTHLNYKNIAETSNSLHVSGWQGLSLGDFPSEVTDQTHKMRCIEAVLEKMFAKYGYRYEIASTCIPLGEEAKHVLSVVAMTSTEGG